ncbi:protein of unknown function [Xenorhabdus bovienii]|uniref:Transposase n=1 Tax=Xenorhabdus bovienii TaxID=40576 RepID=A0A0B6X679_XENBV|nr:protein of unknown function [Xenorhabdus bovienii]
MALFLPILLYLLKYSPQQFGYIRSRWSIETFIFKINKLFKKNNVFGTRN